MKTMTHELNMIDYVLYRNKETTLQKGFRLDMIDHAVFLKSPPKLGDFIPTNEKGEVMEKPIQHSTGEFDTIEVMEWDKAVNRVIWKGWEVEQRPGYSTLQKISDKITMAECYDASTEWAWYGWASYDKLITSGVKLERIEAL